MFYGANPGIFAKAKELRDKLTPAESILWEKLSGNKFLGFKFRRQHPIGCFIADFYCHKAKLVIELDGNIHEVPENKEYDQGRDYEMREMGLKVIRFTNEQVLSNIETVLSDLEGHLNSIK